MQTALITANRHWISQGPRALGPLGQIGSASTPDAIAAWTKATDGKVKQFDNGQGAALHHGPAIDAGRLVGPRHGEAPELLDAPPMYEPPPEPVANPEAAGPEAAVTNGAGTQATAEAVVHDGQEAVATHETNGVREAVREAVTSSSPPPPNGAAGGVSHDGRNQAEIDLEQGRANLAKLRHALMEKQEAEENVSHAGSQRAPDHEGLESDVSTPDHRQTPPPRI